MKETYIGIDVRIDEDWRPQPWRIMATICADAAPVELLCRLPGGVAYISEPLHQEHGDLTALPGRTEEQVGALARRMAAVGCRVAVLEERHRDGVMDTLLQWHGVETRFVTIVDVEDPDGENGTPIGRSAEDEMNTLTRMGRTKR